MRRLGNWYKIWYAIKDGLIIHLKSISANASKISLGIVHAKVEGDLVYYQIPWTSGSLTCKFQSKYGGPILNLETFSHQVTYHGTYAQCPSWTQGNPTYIITLTLNGVTYTTDENTALLNGPIDGT